VRDENENKLTQKFYGLRAQQGLFTLDTATFFYAKEKMPTTASSCRLVDIYNPISNSPLPSLFLNLMTLLSHFLFG
jgi:hypothetical protein